MTKNLQQLAVLLITGGWHLPQHYMHLRIPLERDGYLVSIPPLPSMDGSVPPKRTSEDDAVLIQAEASNLVNQGYPVVVLFHSYGGMVGANALTSDLAFIERRENNKPGGILRLLYMCAFLPQIGDSAASLFANTAPALELEFNDQGNVDPRNPVQGFYNDVVPESEAMYWASKLVTAPASILNTVATRIAWQFFPITYFYTEDDRAMTLELQERMVKAVRDAGVNVHTETFKSDHSPFLSIPQTLYPAVRQVLLDATKVLKDSES